MPLLLWFMSNTLASANALFKSGSDFTWAFMPVVIFFFAGGILGALVGWRSVESSGMAGTMVWGIGLLAIALILIVSAMSAVILVPDAKSMAMLWVSLGAMTIAGGIGVSLFTLWAP
jgi:hypothetical protein